MSNKAERSLAFCYSFVVFSSIICCITSAIGWAHWRYVLNACPETNCGCYLFARSTNTSFEGGHIAYCHYATFGLMLPFVFAIVFGIYHIYRLCIGLAKKESGITRIKQRSGDTVVVTTETAQCDYEVESPYCWLPSCSIACIMIIYTLIYASFYTSGFNNTCKQYRQALLKDIQGMGNIVPVINSRLACSAIFDFMDNLVETISYERRKDGRINSSICFHFTLTFAWFTVMGWIVIAIINITQTKRFKASRA